MELFTLKSAIGVRVINLRWQMNETELERIRAKEGNRTAYETDVLTKGNTESKYMVMPALWLVGDAMLGERDDGSILIKPAQVGIKTQYQDGSPLVTCDKEPIKLINGLVKSRQEIKEC